MQNIFMVVVVNNVEPTANVVHSAILIYLIHFGKIATSVQVFVFAIFIKFLSQ